MGSRMEKAALKHKLRAIEKLEGKTRDLRKELHVVRGKLHEKRVARRAAVEEAKLSFMRTAAAHRRQVHDAEARLRLRREAISAKEAELADLQTKHAGLRLRIQRRREFGLEAPSQDDRAASEGAAAAGGDAEAPVSSPLPAGMSSPSLSEDLGGRSG